MLSLVATNWRRRMYAGSNLRQLCSWIFVSYVLKQGSITRKKNVRVLCQLQIRVPQMFQVRFRTGYVCGEIYNWKVRATLELWIQKTWKWQHAKHLFIRVETTLSRSIISSRNSTTTKRWSHGDRGYDYDTVPTLSSVTRCNERFLRVSIVNRQLERGKFEARNKVHSLWSL